MISEAGSAASSRHRRIIHSRGKSLSARNANDTIFYPVNRRGGCVTRPGRSYEIVPIRLIHLHLTRLERTAGFSACFSCESRPVPTGRCSGQLEAESLRHLNVAAAADRRHRHRDSICFAFYDSQQIKHTLEVSRTTAPLHIAKRKRH